MIIFLIADSVNETTKTPGIIQLNFRSKFIENTQSLTMFVVLNSVVHKSGQQTAPLKKVFMSKCSPNVDPIKN